jgi:hypothetical protein
VAKWTMTIVWDQLIIENILLAGIIVGSIYLEQWGHRRSQIIEERNTKGQIIMYLTDDLQKRLSLMKRTSTVILSLSLQTCGTRLSLRANMHSFHLSRSKVYNGLIPG